MPSYTQHTLYKLCDNERATLTNTSLKWKYYGQNRHNETAVATTRQSKMDVIF